MKGFFKKAAALLMAGLMAGSMAAVPAFAEEAEDAAPEKVELNVAYMPNYASLWSVHVLELLVENSGLQLMLLMDAYNRIW